MRHLHICTVILKAAQRAKISHGRPPARIILFDKDCIAIHKASVTIKCWGSAIQCNATHMVFAPFFLLKAVHLTIYVKNTCSRCVGVIQSFLLHSPCVVRHLICDISVTLYKTLLKTKKCLMQWDETSHQQRSQVQHPMWLTIWISLYMPCTIQTEKDVEYKIWWWNIYEISS